MFFVRCRKVPIFRTFVLIEHSLFIHRVTSIKVIQTSSFAGAFNKSSRSPPLPKLERVVQPSANSAWFLTTKSSLLFSSSPDATNQNCVPQPVSINRQRSMDAVMAASLVLILCFSFLLPQFSWQEGLPFVFYFFSLILGRFVFLWDQAWKGKLKLLGAWLYKEKPTAWWWQILQF